MKETNFESIVDKLNTINIIDIRDKYLYNLENIPNSINIPINYLMINPENYLNKDEEYYIYCNCGISSKKLCEYLIPKGYNVINIKGGYRTYKLLKHIIN